MTNSELMSMLKGTKINHNQRTAIFFLVGISLVGIVIVTRMYQSYKKISFEKDNLQNDINFLLSDYERKIDDQNLIIQQLNSKIQGLNNMIVNNIGVTQKES